MNITGEQIAVFRSLFCTGRTDAYGSYYLDTGRYYVRNEPITEGVILRHLEGAIPCGVYPVRTEMTRFAVADFDKDDGSLPLKFVAAAGRYDIHAYIERSKRKGFHAWLFFQCDVLAKKAIDATRSILASIGAFDVEVFPKQARVEAGGLGNFINCPLFGRLVTQGRTVFVDQDLRPYVDQWEFLRSIERVPELPLDAAIRLTGVVQREPEQPHPVSAVSPTASNRTPPGDRTFGLKPCARRMLAEGVTFNQRCACFRLAVQLRKAGLPTKSAVAALTEWATRNHPADGRAVISLNEIVSQTESAYLRQYAGCGCNDGVVRSFCDPNCELRIRRKTGQAGESNNARSP